MASIPHQLPAGARSPHLLERGRYRVRLASGNGDLRAVQELRHRAFFPRRHGPGLERDAFDARWDHLLIESRADGRLLGGLRFTLHPDGRRAMTGYSALHYDLSALADHRRPMLEMGRFCTAPGCDDPDVLRMALAGLARIVRDQGVELIFGCASFAGAGGPAGGEGRACPAREDAFALLGARHIAPRRWRPRIKAPDVLRFSRLPRAGGPAGAGGQAFDPARALRALPPLLRSYISLGGRVSDHAVVDREMNTLHVFTGLEISALPPARRRRLLALAG